MDILYRCDSAVESFNLTGQKVLGSLMLGTLHNRIGIVGVKRQLAL